MSAPALLTMRDRIRSVPARFRSQYEKTVYWEDRTWHHGGTARSMTEALEALDLESCSEADVDAAMGVAKPGFGWCRSRCDGCEKTVEGDVVCVGDERDYDSNSATLCVPCLRAALALVQP